MSSEEEDIHQCGRCKQVFHDIDRYFVHKKAKSCSKVKANTVKDGGIDELAGGDAPPPQTVEPVKSARGVKRRKRGRKPKQKVDIEEHKVDDEAVTLQVEHLTGGRKLRARKHHLCIVCGHKALSVKALEEHKTSEHGDEIDDQEQSKHGDTDYYHIDTKVVKGEVTDNRIQRRPRSKRGRKPKLHATLEEDEKVFACKQCDEVFPRQYLLRKHFEKSHHVQSKPIICKWCGDKFTKSILYKKHMRSVHKIQDYQSNTCPVCSRVLKSHFHVKRHRDTLHSPVGAEDYIVPDSMCAHAESDEKQPEGEHVTDEESIVNAASTLASLSDKENNHDDNKEKIVPCLVCLTECPGQRAFRCHLECHRIWIPDPDKMPEKPLSPEKSSMPEKSMSQESVVVEETTIAASEMISFAAQQGGVLNGVFYDQSSSQGENMDYATIESSHPNQAQINQMIQEQAVLNILQEMGQAAQLMSPSQNQPISNTTQQQLSQLVNASQNQPITSTSQQHAAQIMNTSQNHLIVSSAQLIGSSQNQTLMSTPHQQVAQSQPLPNTAQQDIGQLMGASQTQHILSSGQPQTAQSLSVSQNQHMLSYAQLQPAQPMSQPQNHDVTQAVCPSQRSGQDGNQNVGDNPAFSETPSQEDSSTSESALQSQSTNESAPSENNSEDQNSNNVLNVESANYICPHCCKLFASFNNMCKHFREEHSLVPVFRCVKESCRMIFKTMDDYIEHGKTHDQRAFICCICNQHFETNYLMSMHKSIEHKNVHKTGFYSNGLSCPTCQRCFPTLERLQHHVKHDPHVHKCTICEKVFKTDNQLESHLLTHTGTKTYLCDECGQKFVTIPALKKHQRTHNPSRTYVCDICGHVFNKREHVKRHMVTKHSQEKPFKCTFADCTKAFKRGDKLSEHMRIHTGDLRFICNECGKCYNNRAGLRYHETTHSRVLPIKHTCPQCPAGFYTQKALTQHLATDHDIKRNHTPTIQCRVCNVYFYRIERMNRHMERDHAITVEWKEVCQQCGRGFLGKKSLQTHIEERHNAQKRTYVNKRRKKQQIPLDNIQNSAGQGIIMSLDPNHMVQTIPQQQQQQQIQHQSQTIQISASSGIEFVPQLMNAQTQIIHQGQVGLPTALPHMQQVYQHEEHPPPQQVSYQYQTGFMHY